MPGVHVQRSVPQADRRPSLAPPRGLSALLGGALPEPLSAALAQHIRAQRWYRGKARRLRGLDALDTVPLTATGDELALALVRVRYEAGSELYVLPLGLARAQSRQVTGALCQVALPGESDSGTVYDPSGSDRLARALFELCVREETPGVNGTVTAQPGEPLLARVTAAEPMPAPRVPTGEQSNTSVFFGRELMLKVFRLLEPGQNPDVELNEILWEGRYRHVPEPLGEVSYALGGQSYTLGLVQRFVPSEGIAWEVTLDVLVRAFEIARALAAEQVTPRLPSGDLLDSTRQAPPASIHAFVSEYMPFAALLGRRTAELHRALAARTDLAACAPEPFTLDYQESIVQATRARIAQGFALLGQQIAHVPEHARPLADMVLHERAALEGQLDVLDRVRVRASRIRCHGDYHLGQVLYADHDFTLLDFEGEPAQPMAARRQKLSALYDVAGMLRSFHYAATFVLQSDRWSARERSLLGPWAEAWYRWSSAAFLCGYLRAAREDGPAVFLPEDHAELRALFRLHTLDKCSYELSYELNNRPAWVGVPLAGLHSLVASS